MDKSRYYQPSGTAPVGGIISGMVTALAVAFVLGGLYGIIDHYNPFIYINFLGALMLGAVSGGVVRWRVSQGKIRSRAIARLMAVAAGFASLYCAWGAYLTALFEWDIIVVDPIQMFHFINGVAQVGAWEMKGTRPLGMALYSIWAIEAGVVLFFAYNAALDNEIPYCEDCNEWTTSKLTNVHVPLMEATTLNEDLETENYEPFLANCSQPVVDAEHLVVTVNGCENCDMHYLKVDRVKPKADGDGFETKMVTPWLKTDGQLLVDLQVRIAQAAAAAPPSAIEKLVPDAPPAEVDPKDAFES